MASLIQVRLVSFDYTVNFDTSKLISLFPNSLFTKTLEQDSTATVIEISVPVVTPRVMDIIKNVIDTGKSPAITDPVIRQELVKAGDYLNMNYLQVISDPLFPDMLEQYPQFDPINPKVMSNPKAYSILLRYLMSLDRDMEDKYISRYLIQHALFDVGAEDQQLLEKAITSRRLDIMELLLKRGADPSVNHNKFLIDAVEFGKFEVVNRLLQDPRVDPSDQKNQAILIAAENGDQSMIDRLLQDPRVKATVDMSKVTQLLEEEAENVRKKQEYQEYQDSMLKYEQARAERDAADAEDEYFPDFEAQEY